MKFWANVVKLVLLGGFVSWKNMQILCLLVVGYVRVGMDFRVWQIWILFIYVILINMVCLMTNQEITG